MTLLKDRYDASNQEEKCQAELSSRRRKPGEDLQSLRPDITSLMTYAYPGEMSTMVHRVARDHFITALNDPKLALKVREREPKNLDEAFTIVLRLVMILTEHGRGESATSVTTIPPRHVRAVEIDTPSSADLQKSVEEIQIINLTQLQELKLEAKMDRELMV